MFVATFSLPHEGVALEETFRAVPDLEIRAERVAAHSTEWVMPSLWVCETDSDALTEAFDADPSVSKVVTSVEFDRETYYQIEWSERVIERIDAFVDVEATVLEATADADGWRLRVRFASRSQLDRFREYLTDEDVSFELLDLAENGPSHGPVRMLTADQRTALVAAKEDGYYEIPKETTLRELAADLDISHQTLSEHLRRGTQNFIDATITAESEHV